MNLIDLTTTFGTPENCSAYLEAMRWPGGEIACLKCESKKITEFTKRAGTRQRLNPKTGQLETKSVPPRFLYVCLDCKYQFSVTTGTIFNDTHLDLEKWLLAVAIMCNAKKGVSALQIKRDLKCAYKTAWHLNHRIRQAMALIEQSDEDKLGGTVKADETFVGSKKHDKRRKRAKYEKDSRCSTR